MEAAVAGVAAAAGPSNFRVTSAAELLRLLLLLLPLEKTISNFN